jgi:glucose/mannose transport system substrate-binding protein
MKKLFVSMLVVLLLSVCAFGNQVEIFSWWTGGGEEAGLLALIDELTAMYPGLEVVNATVAGGAGSNAKAVLKTRMLGGNPPDSFQVHAGQELTDTYVVTGKMESLTKYLEEWGYMDKFPKDILDICSYEGEVYSIPVNVHRGNVVFYSKKIAKEIGMTEEPTSWEQFLVLLQKAKDAGYTALSLGDKNKWTATHLFEDIMLSQYGAADYTKLFLGEESFNSIKMDASLMLLKHLIPFFNKDHASLTWQDASRLVYEEKAFCNVMGDWAEGYYKELGWTPNEEFGWFMVPETESFMVVSDTFGLPKGAPNKENALKWLKFIGSTKAQDIFNPIKGSIPARVDADTSIYDEYLQWSMNDFATLPLAPSIAHGSAAPGAFSGSLSDVINIFLSNEDVEEAKESIMWAAEDEDYNVD